MSQSKRNHMHAWPIEFEYVRQQSGFGLDHRGQWLRCPTKRREQIARHQRLCLCECDCRRTITCTFMICLRRSWISDWQSVAHGGRSVFVSQHNRDHALGDRSVCCIWGMVLEALVVVDPMEREAPNCVLS